MLDLVIENGRVADGAGKPIVAADVGVRGDKIAAVGNLGEARARERLDASGLVVSPGFIDIHTHSDFSLLARGGAESQVLQGVTFEVVGNCGHSCAPIGRAENPRKLTLGHEPSIKIDWATFDGYLSRLERGGLGVNAASFVGHCTLRHAVMRGAPRPATDDETDAMRRMLEESLEQGAIGFSTGLEYNPGKAARSEEIAELCKSAGRRGALYATHVRNRDLFYEVGFGEAHGGRDANMSGSHDGEAPAGAPMRPRDDRPGVLIGVHDLGAAPVESSRRRVVGWLCAVRSRLLEGRLRGADVVRAAA